MSIKFKETYYDENEALNVTEALLSGTDFLSEAEKRLSDYYGCKVYLTANGSTALDLLLFAYEFPKGGEVILPSFTYPSAANSILRLGLDPVFCDIDPETLVMDIDDALKRKTAKTVCVIPTHYGGASCDMERLRGAFSDIKIIEDAALSFGAKYNDKPLGAIGDAGIISFHKTKNVSSDEGGAVILNDESIIKKLDIIYENGTDRRAFLNGEVSFYSWQDVGMNAKMSNIAAAVLCAQLDRAEEITAKQRLIYDCYMKALEPFKKHGIHLPLVPDNNKNNAHVFYIVMEDEAQKQKVANLLKEAGIEAVIHYVPLHTAGKWQNMGKTALHATEHVCQCMLRLPMHAKMKPEDCEEIAKRIGECYEKN